MCTVEMAAASLHSELANGIIGTKSSSYSQVSFLQQQLELEAVLRETSPETSIHNQSSQSCDTSSQDSLAPASSPTRARRRQRHARAKGPEQSEAHRYNRLKLKDTSPASQLLAGEQTTQSTTPREERLPSGMHEQERLLLIKYNKLKLKAPATKAPAHNRWSWDASQTHLGARRWPQENHTKKLHSTAPQPKLLITPPNSRSPVHLTTMLPDHIAQTTVSKSRSHSRSKQSALLNCSTSYNSHTPVNKTGQPPANRTGLSPLPSMGLGVPFVEQPVKVSFDYTGGLYHLENHGFSLFAPRGAIKKNSTLMVKIAVALHGPFHFPQQVRPVSPVFLLCSQTQDRLHKPVSVSLPHFIELSGCTEPERKRLGLRFMKAGHFPCSSTPVSCAYYSFQQAEGRAVFQSGSGVLTTKHLCYLCICATDCEETSQRTNHCMIPVVPRLITLTSWKLHYCITFQLKTCIEAVKQQYDTGFEVQSPQRFNVKSSSGITIAFERKLEEGSWLLALEGTSRISARSLDLWSQQGSHCPPRFTIRVHGDHARTATVAQINILGATEPLVSEVILPLKRLSTLDAPSLPPSLPASLESDSSKMQASKTTDYPVMSYTSGQHTPLYDLLAPRSSPPPPSPPTLTPPHTPSQEPPTDKELECVAACVVEVMGESGRTVLATHLGLQDTTLHTGTPHRQKVLKLLKEWRVQTSSCSRMHLAHCLRKVGPKKLHTVASQLEMGDCLLPMSP